MKLEEKLIQVIRRMIKRMVYDYGIQIGEMTSSNTLTVHGMEIKSTELLFIESSTVNLATKVAIQGTVETGGGGESPHTHPFSYEDKSTYINKLKAGDKVVLLRHNQTFVCLGKVVTL